MLRPTPSLLAPIATALVLALAAAPLASKETSAIPKDLPPVFEAVVNCRTLTSDSERLACYDRSVAALAAARDKADIVVADRATIRETKKGLFGFTLPKLKLFGAAENDGDDVKEIESTITAVRRTADGLAIFTLADGARWKQTDGGATFAKPGIGIRIKRGTLGSYLASIDKGAFIRVVRLAQ
ncbi:hypothetical protein AQZ52_02860 [Novosphingobium fuchskuhlense]|uniref:Lysozyme inhibitor LprI N-terminal domain-containing protein n=1 Tax=Novosphingobium fuchskuhlense TaxID=1117702 RepID=A0A117UWN9_9SPHN|nr:hypothetical protein [Novosphingobium fuchskuhlense]KUR72240.1 hypothetical protein AQZ52_02860 [Novosphingobium fuchskuhlense]